MGWWNKSRFNQFGNIYGAGGNAGRGATRSSGAGRGNSGSSGLGIEYPCELWNYGTTAAEENLVLVEDIEIDIDVVGGVKVEADRRRSGGKGLPGGEGGGANKGGNGGSRGTLILLVLAVAVVDLVLVMAATVELLETVGQTEPVVVAEAVIMVEQS